jgi:hypothetical protein
VKKITADKSENIQMDIWTKTIGQVDNKGAASK